MIDHWLFVLAVIAILMIPGPGNALVASSAHQHGQAKTILFLPAILLGYLYAINFWALIIHLMSPIWPNFQTLVHLSSSIYMGWMTFRLCRVRQLEKHHQQHPFIRPWHMFTATLKNPKAALFAAGILPAATWDNPINFAMVFAVFALVSVPVVIFWMSFGQVILSGQSKKIKTDLLYKASVLLLLLCFIPIILHFFES
jgi:threonine/homoserine/homoserine lactone efflux protein